MLVTPYAAEAGRRRAGTPQTPRSSAARVQPARGFVVLAVAAALLAAWSHVRSRPQRAALAAAALPGLPPSSSFLVTGAAGFIGMHVATRLKHEGHRVVGLDSYTRYYSTALKEERTRRLAAVGVAVANATVCDERLVVEMLDEHAVTHVVHLAAQPGIELSVTQPRLYIRNNVECFAVLLEAMLKARRLPRLVYASSSSVYGHATPPFKEGQPVRPANVYGATKAQMELLAGVYAQLHGVASAGLRFFTVYGPYMRPDMAVYAFAAKLVQNETITLKGTNLARDFTYVDDVVGGVVRAAGFLSAHSGTAPGEVPCEVFNVGSGAIRPVEDVVTILNALLGTHGVPEYASRTRHDMLTTGASLEKSRQLLRYTPRTHLPDGLASFAAWFTRTRNHEWDFKEHRNRCPTHQPATMFLPPELLLQTMHFLPHADLGICDSVCKGFKRVVDDHYKSLWGSRLVTVGCVTEAPSGRTCHSAVSWNNKMYAIGGMTDTTKIMDVKKELCILDMSTWEWRTVADLCVPAVTEQTAVMHGDAIYLFGGYYVEEGRKGRLYKISGLEGDVPSVVQLCVNDPCKPPPRSSHTAAVHDGKMLIFGGWDKVIPKNDLFEFDLTHHTWRRIHGCSTDDASQFPTPRRAHTSFVIGGSMFVFGGTSRKRNEDIECRTDRIDVFNIRSGGWEVREVMGDVPCPRSRCDGVVHGDLFVLAGGWDRANTEHLSDCYCFSATTSVWRKLAINMPFGIVQHSLVKWQDKLVMFGGYKTPTAKSKTNASSGRGDGSVVRTQSTVSSSSSEGSSAPVSPVVAAKDKLVEKGYTANDIHLYQLKALPPQSAFAVR